MTATVPTNRTAVHDDTMIRLRHCQLGDRADHSHFPKNDAGNNSTGGRLHVHSGEKNGPKRRNVRT